MSDDTLKVAINMATQSISVILLLIARQPEKLQEHLQSLREVTEELRKLAR